MTVWGYLWRVERVLFLSRALSCPWYSSSASPSDTPLADWETAQCRFKDTSAAVNVPRHLRTTCYIGTDMRHDPLYR